MKYFIKSIIFIAVFVGMSLFSRKELDGFQICKISSNLPFNAAWEVPIPQKGKLAAIKKALDQPFSYFGKGSQAFVFVSADQQYVIKLIRYNHLRPSIWEKLASPDKGKALEGKLERDFTSYKIAYEDLSEETGLLFLHLNKTDFFDQKLVIVDKIGIAHTLDLDSTDFILQKRVNPLYPHLKRLMDEQKEEEAKHLISHLVSLLTKQYQKGIVNTDVDLFKNFGCLDQQTIELDVGSLKKETLLEQKEEIRRVTECLHQRLSKITPL
ncbi:MAG: hypothetical protein LVR00_01090 [Rhabdochlamydiaceae bacterium]